MYINSNAYRHFPLADKLLQDVAEQVCSFVKNSSVTGANAVVDCGSIL